MSNDLFSTSGVRPAAAHSLPSLGQPRAPVQEGGGAEAVSAASSQGAPDPRESQRRVEEAVEFLNQQMRSTGRDLAFSVDRLVDRTIITVKETQTGKVIRQIPDEALLRVAYNIEQLKGVLLNDTV